VGNIVLEELVLNTFRIDKYTWGNTAKLGEGRTGMWAVRGTNMPAGSLSQRADVRGKMFRSSGIK
jgi:hypothetical protein